MSSTLPFTVANSAQNLPFGDRSRFRAPSSRAPLRASKVGSERICLEKRDGLIADPDGG